MQSYRFLKTTYPVDCQNNGMNCIFTARYFYQARPFQFSSRKNALLQNT